MKAIKVNTDIILSNDTKSHTVVTEHLKLDNINSGEISYVKQETFFPFALITKKGTIERVVAEDEFTNDLLQTVYNS